MVIPVVLALLLIGCRALRAAAESILQIQIRIAIRQEIATARGTSSNCALVTTLTHAMVIPVVLALLLIGCRALRAAAESILQIRIRIAIRQEIATARGTSSNCALVTTLTHAMVVPVVFAL